MPVYEYECSKCRHSFEEIQKFSDEPLKDCPKCNEKNCLTKKFPSSSSFQLKGDGWTKKDHMGSIVDKVGRGM